MRCVAVDLGFRLYDYWVLCIMFAGTCGQWVHTLSSVVHLLLFPLCRDHKDPHRATSSGPHKLKRPPQTTNGGPHSRHSPPPSLPGPNSPIISSSSSSQVTRSSVSRQGCLHQPLPMVARAIPRGPLCSPHKPLQLLPRVHLLHHPM